LWNDKTSSGLTHGDTLRGLLKTMFSIRSNYNIRKNLLFYRRHATSPLAYLYLLRSYFMLTAGFIKWKILALFGKRK
jgi:hypothetical protein